MPGRSRTRPGAPAQHRSVIRREREHLATIEIDAMRAEPPPMGDDAIAVASVSARHVYVRHIAAPDDAASGVIHLREPSPDRSTREAHPLPPMLQPRWLRETRYDVLHLQLGFDHVPPEALREALSVVQQRGCPFVYTAHDLRNPLHEDSSLHDRHLDLLMDEADAVITLTGAAAEEIRRRWGRDALVLPHPHVIEFETMKAHHARRGGPAAAPRAFRIGMHLLDLPANMDPLTILPVLEETVAGLPGAVLQVNGHRDAIGRHGPRQRGLADYLQGADRAGRLELHLHEAMDDAALADYIDGLDASVLPHRFGTHSGWLEACRDLGTRVIAPTCGFYAEQGPVLSYHMDEHHFDPDTLVAAVTAAYAEPPSGPVTVPERRREREGIAAAHEGLYRRLLS